MTQNDRILRALRNGPVNPVDFQAPRVCDGGAPILRVAARINDLQANGHRIRSDRADNRTSTYTLVQEAGHDSGSENTPTKPSSGGSSAVVPSRPLDQGDGGQEQAAVPTLFPLRGDYRDVAA